MSGCRSFIRRCPTGSGRRPAMTTPSFSNCDGGTCRSCSRGTSAAPWSRRSCRTSSRRRCACVKVPHHGSLTSSSWPFVRQLAPTAAVFSAGRGNAFGHPAPEVVARYEAVGAEIFRTDQDGAVFFDTDGYRLDGTNVSWSDLERLCHEITKTRKASMINLDSPLDDELEQLVRKTIGCCIRVHRELGPGCSRGSTPARSASSSRRQGLPFEREKPVPRLLPRTSPRSSAA